MPDPLSLARRPTARGGANTLRLLVSVRDADEARVAAECGADIVDAKDPAREGLAGVSNPLLEAIVAAVSDRCPVSAAVGDIGDQAIVDAGHAASAGVIFIKVGCERIDAVSAIATWLRRATEVLGAARADPRSCALVVAAYADRPAARDANRFVDLAARGGAAGVLLDTLHKTGPSLFGAMPPDVVARWVETVHATGLWVALAGGLAVADIEVARSLGADIIGVRGAACVGGRTGHLSADRVRALVRLTRETAPDRYCPTSCANFGLLRSASHSGSMRK